MASSSWGVPSHGQPVALGGQVGILTPGALQFYTTNGDRTKTIKFTDRVILPFTSDHTKKELFCAITEGASTIDLCVYAAETLQLTTTIANVAQFTVLAGAVSSCGAYVSILAGLPEWKVKVFALATGACIVEYAVEPVDAVLHMSHCPQSWRQIGVVTASKATIINVQSFGESLEADMVIVESVTRVEQLEHFKETSANTSKVVKELWSEHIDQVRLNCETTVDPELVFTDATWRGKDLYVSRALGDIWSLPNKTLVYGTGVEAKNLISLQSEIIASEPGQVKSLVSFNKGEDVLFCGCNGVFILSTESIKKKKRSTMTICRVEPTFGNDKTPTRLIKLSNTDFVVQMRGIYRCETDNICFELNQPEKSLLKYSYNSSTVSAACPSNDGCIIVARDNGQVQVYSSEIDVEFNCKLDDVIVELQQGPISGLYFGGMKNGSLCVLSIDDSGIKVLAKLRLFDSPLDFLAIDPYGRGLVAGSTNNDRVLILGWSSDSREDLTPHVYGFVGVDGTIKSLSISADSPTSPMSVLVALAASPVACIDAAITFELSADSLKSGDVKLVNNLRELDPKQISLGVAKLPNVNSIFMTDAISKRATCFASSSAQKQIRQIELELGNTTGAVAGFSRSLAKVNSHHVTFAKPFHGLWIASACRSGQVLMTRNLNEKINMPSTVGQFNMKFDRLGSALVVYNKGAVYSVNLAIKPELQQRVVECAKKRETFIRPLWKGSSGEYAPIEKVLETTWFERQTEVAMTEQNNKYSSVKASIEDDLDKLRHVVTDMLAVNCDAIDLEKLDEHEFNLDEAAMAEYRTRENSLVSSIQAEYGEKKSQAAEIAARITRHYWDEMETGPRTVKSFGGHMAIENFEIGERHADKAVELDDATEERRVLIEEEELVAKKERKQNQADHDDQVEEVMISRTGTLSEHILPEDPLLKSQFRLNSISDRKLHLIFIEERIQKLKKHFNEQFNQSYRQKEAELNRIYEHNLRIEQIQAELELPIGTQTPEMDVWERPEVAFVVKDEEVKVERVLTDGQQAQLDEERRLEELRRAAGGDNWRDRGLKDMMDGVIEVKKEDVLKQDILMPDFMSDPELHEADWSDEHKKLKAEYEKRVKQLSEDRAKHKKGLESEIKKLQQMVKDSIANFDVGLNDLYQKKLTINAAIHQEELIVRRLSKSIEWSKQTSLARGAVEAAIEEYRKIKQEKSKLIGAWRMAAEHKRQHVESQVQEEKLMERQFKTDLEKAFELSAINIDVFVKYYKRRPKTGETLEQIDADFEAPIGVDDAVAVWVQQQRALKLAQEAELKRQNALLAKASAFVESRRAEDEQYEKSINQLIGESETVARAVADCGENLSIQLLLKQGQVEIEIEESSFTEALFVHREVVEDLNSQIKQYGQNKIDAMLESKDFRKGIHMLEWERRRLEMEIEDLTQKAQDIQMLKLTRELQTVLSSNNTNSNAGELSRIDKTLQSQNGTFRKRADRSQLETTKLNTQMDELNRENTRLDDLLANLHVSVSERRNIRDTHIQPDTTKIMRDIARRRKLVEISRSQQNEIALLRNELERLRKKTFPALVKLNR